jgi:hypothetical protein
MIISKKYQAVICFALANPDNNLTTNKLLNELKRKGIKPKDFLYMVEKEKDTVLDIISKSAMKRIKSKIKQADEISTQLGLLRTFITYYGETSYPKILKEELKEKAPVFLAIKGNYTIFNDENISKYLVTKDISIEDLRTKEGDYSFIAYNSETISKGARLAKEGAKVIFLLEFENYLKLIPEELQSAKLKYNNTCIVSPVYFNSLLKFAKIFTSSQEIEAQAVGV